MTFRLGLAALFAASTGIAVPAAPTPLAVPGSSARAPYDAAPAPGVSITITLDPAAARGILDLLSAPQFDADAAKALEALPAVAAALRDSKRPPEVFEHDLAVAFDEKARPTIFDFRAIREDRGRWKDLLAVIVGRDAELTKLASDRARALMPADRPVTVTEAISLTFGLPGRADHIAVPEPGGASWSIVIDLARALSDVQSSPAAEQIKRLSRLMAAEAYQRAWAEYRAHSPAWHERDASLGHLEPLLRKVAEAGPVAIYSVDENFFPLAVWLKRPMKDDLDELNRVADRLVSSAGDLDARMTLAAEIQKPDFTAGVAGPAGTFLSDGIIQALGVDAYRAALAGGPREFFEAYERASQRKGSGLVPLGKAIRAQLAGAAAPGKS
ncbi:MAG TPA: hypothetical protein VN032_06790 [Thermoanaerobaculia bacterium]|nr:hypothetical protein [Thermoanaerobaculia bacterium]